MSERLSDLLDLREAWIRIKRESRSRPYLTEPFEVPLVEVDQKGWLDDLDERIATGYHPAPAELLELPKGAGATRPIARLALDDRVVYTALIGACHRAIHSGLSWSQGTVDFSHQLGVEGSGRWLKAPVRGWSLFREQSEKALDQGFSWVVVSDVTAFYENVDIKTLISDLAALNSPEPALRLLSRMLNKWASVTGRGLPQGAQASDILSKVYLNPVDLRLRNAGWTHLRYSDDLRIFCSTRREALVVLRDLARVLRERGLHLQSAKSQVLRADEAREKFQGVVPTLRAIRHRLLLELAEAFDLDDPYLTPDEFDALLSENPDDAPGEVLREAFDSYFMGESVRPFDKTLFHFLLNRLGVAEDPHALPQVVPMLGAHPEETDYLLRYVDAVAGFEVMESPILEYAASEQGRLYDWQTQQILSWLDERALPSNTLSLSFARVLASSPESSRHVRALSRRILGRWGNLADIEAIQSRYATATNDLQRAQILCSLKRMEKGRRNSFLGRVQDDGPMPARAVALVRASRGRTG